MQELTIKQKEKGSILNTISTKNKQKHIRLKQIMQNQQGYIFDRLLKKRNKYVQ